MEDLFISICIPAYNSEKFILETLNSIKNQTHKNWEIIVVEDASNDNTKNIVETFEKNCFQKVTYFRNEKNVGASAIRNVAAGLSIGDWLAFLDSDDLWENNHLQTLIETYRKSTNCDFIHGLAHIFDSDTGNIINSQYLTQKTIERFPVSLFDRSYFIQTSSIMISRKLFNKTGGFNTTLRYCDDLEMWFKSAKLGFKFVTTGMYTTKYRKVVDGGLTANSLKITFETAKIYDFHSDWSEIDERLRMKQASQIWFSVARMARKRDRSLSIQSINKSIKYKYGVRNLSFWILMLCNII